MRQAMLVVLGLGVLLVALFTSPSFGAQNNFRMFPETGGAYSSSIRIAPTYVDVRVLAANVAEAHTVPTSARFVIFSSTCNFYANAVTTAAVPGADVTNGSASELNPAAWFIEGVTTISLIAANACTITMAFYK